MLRRSLLRLRGLFIIGIVLLVIHSPQDEEVPSSSCLAFARNALRQGRRDRNNGGSPNLWGHPPAFKSRTFSGTSSPMSSKPAELRTTKGLAFLRSGCSSSRPGEFYAPRQRTKSMKCP